MLAGAAGARGFDDCRVINILSMARTARYIGDDDLAQLLGHHARRTVLRYVGWGQYLDSVLVGKAVFQAAFAEPGSAAIIDPRQFIDAVHLLALSAGHPVPRHAVARGGPSGPASTPIAPTGRGCPSCGSATWAG